MKLTPNITYNCNCEKTKSINDNDIPKMIIRIPRKNSSQIITFYKSKNKKEKNKTLF